VNVVTVSGNAEITTIPIRAEPATGTVPNGVGVDAGAEDELVVLLIRTAKAVVDGMRAEHPDRAASSPLTPVHGLAARYLVGRDDVTTVELARHLGITKQSASEVVSALEKTGTVRRAPHPSDGRARVLLLTDEGTAKLEEGRRRWRRVEHEWAALVGQDRLDVVRDVLERVLAADVDARDGRVARDQSSSCAAS
jgi:DNA-binding MarR family transcriptional regulator